MTVPAREEAPPDWLVYLGLQEPTAAQATLDKRASRVILAHQVSVEDKAPMAVMVRGASLGVKERKGYPTTPTWDWE